VSTPALPAGALRAAAAFNTKYPIGTPVRYWPWTREGPGIVSKTRSEAWVLASGPVVLVEGRAGGIYLTHVEPLGEAHG
jgi:hypothetical protein